MVVQYIAASPILDICLDTSRRLVLNSPKRWWEQEGLVFPGMQVAGEEVTDGGRDEYKAWNGDGCVGGVGSGERDRDRGG